MPERRLLSPKNPRVTGNGVFSHTVSKGRDQTEEQRLLTTMDVWKWTRLGK